MDRIEGSASQGVLHAWRTTVLNIFLLIVVAASIPALAASIVNEVQAGGLSWFTYGLSACEAVLIAPAVFRKIPCGVRVGGLLPLGYAGKHR